MIRTLLIFLVKVYRLLVSPLLGQTCRFYPSCSEYAMEAVASHGAAKGSILTVKRLCRCHPLCEGGIDPVPEHFSFTHSKDPKTS